MSGFTWLNLVYRRWDSHQHEPPKWNFCYLIFILAGTSISLKGRYDKGVQCHLSLEIAFMRHLLQDNCVTWMTYCIGASLKIHLKLLSAVSFHTQISGRSRISPRWGANSPRGAPTYDFAKISQKLHEIERIWTPRGAARPKFYYVDPPLQMYSRKNYFRSLSHWTSLR